MNYRLYFYDTADQISHVFPFDCVNDTLAQSIAELHAQGTTYELWNRDRLVTRKQYALEDVEFPVGLRRRGYNI
jgi:hypothetical protein